RVWISSKIDWLVDRHFGTAGRAIPAAEVDDAPDSGIVFETDYGDARGVIAWAFGLGDRARILGPPELVEEARQRIDLIVERHSTGPEVAPRVTRSQATPPAAAQSDADSKRETPIRPERFA